jgi:cytidine deaminase
MREFNVRTVILTDEAGDPVEYTLDELLPRSFGPEDLT